MGRNIFDQSLLIFIYMGSGKIIVTEIEKRKDEISSKDILQTEIKYA